MHLSILRRNQNMDISAFFSRKVQFVPMNVQGQSTSTVRKTFKRDAKDPLGHIYILRQFENLNNLGNVENRPGEGRPNFPISQVKQSIPTYSITQKDSWGEQLHI